MKEGDTGEELLFLASGEVKVVKQGRLLNVLRTGSYLGEMAHVKAGQIPRQATVETLTDALIAESLRRGKQAETERQHNAALNDNQPASENSAASSQHQNPFQREPGQSRHRAQHEGE